MKSDKWYEIVEDMNNFKRKDYLFETSYRRLLNLGFSCKNDLYIHNDSTYGKRFENLSDYVDFLYDNFILNKPKALFMFNKTKKIRTIKKMLRASIYIFVTYEVENMIFNYLSSDMKDELLEEADRFSTLIVIKMLNNDIVYDEELDDLRYLDQKIYKVR